MTIGSILRKTTNKNRKKYTANYIKNIGGLTFGINSLFFDN